MQIINRILQLINGKKATIAAILGAIVTFLVGRNIIQPDMANLISVILIALGFGANMINARNDKTV